MGSLIEDIRKEQIINTAITTIADKGFINTPLSEIAKEAGISKGVISYYFKSKDELVKKVMDKILSDSKKYLIKLWLEKRQLQTRLLLISMRALTIWRSINSILMHWSICGGALLPMKKGLISTRRVMTPVVTLSRR